MGVVHMVNEVRLIDANALINYVAIRQRTDSIPREDAAAILHFVEHHAPTVDAVQIVRCKNCKHRPLHIDGYIYLQPPQLEDGFDDWTCPYVCEDPYYTKMPKDDSYCSKGEAIEQ